MATTLILGGARSGKSARALELADALAPASDRRVFLATAEACDDEMAARIARHRRERDDQGWQLVEIPLDIADALSRADLSRGLVLVDCLTLWLSNVFAAGLDPERETARLVEILSVDGSGRRILVANELGLGLVPETPLGRAFRDAHGRMNRRIAAIADAVEFVVAGLPLVIKSSKTQDPAP